MLHKPKNLLHKTYYKIFRLLLLALLGLSTVLSIPALSVPQNNENNFTISQVSSANTLLQQGIESYRAENYIEALSTWQEALQAFTTNQDILNQALVLNNISLAYQHLGEIENAEREINRSFQILDNLENAPNSLAYAEVSAKVFNTQARLQWTKGQLEEALETWKKAENYYKAANNKLGEIGSSINQAQALQALGLNLKSETKLREILLKIQQQSDPYLQAKGWLQLGQILRKVGKLEKANQDKINDPLASWETLNRSLNAAEKVDNPELKQQLKTSILLELGNTQRALATKNQAIGKNKVAQKNIDSAFEYYQRAIEIAKNSQKIQAQLNQLSLLVETGQSSKIPPLVNSIKTKITNMKASPASIYAQLNFARSLTCLQPLPKTDSPLCVNNQQQKEEELSQEQLPTWTQIAQIIAHAIKQAQQIDNLKAQSYAIGQLGGMYELNQQWNDAQNMTQQALTLIENNNLSVPELRYLWEWQLGRLLRQKGDTKRALYAYESAVADLNLVRNNLSYIDSDIQFSFRDKVEPVYRTFVDLLLQNENTDELSQEDLARVIGNRQPSKSNLEKAIDNIDTLQLAELENFLGCNLSTLKLNQETDTIDPKAAFIYPIILEDRIAIIVELPSQEGAKQKRLLSYKQTLVSQQEVEKSLSSLRAYLTVSGNTPEILPEAQKLYQWIIEPLKLDLENNPQIDTLVFVLDGNLRNIPMGVLYDGEKYFIEQKYAIAVAPRLTIFSPSASKQELNVFTGGVGNSQEIEGIDFPEIENLEEELEEIAKTTNSNLPLLNENFTRNNIEQQLENNRFSVIHWKTHGVFSSDPEQTFLVTHGGSVKARDLNNLINTGSQGGIEPIELLVLSACETAQGDNRAVLGLAGIAVRTGARSTVSTLWRADDFANTELMKSFYQELSNGATKAEALHKAQLFLFNEYGTQDPYIWATYILVGNWL